MGLNHTDRALLEQAAAEPLSCHDAGRPSIIFMRSGGPPAAPITSATSRKYARAHDRWSYDGELFHILAAQVIEAVHRASRDAQRLRGTDLNRRAVNRPCKDALNTVQDLLVGIVLDGPAPYSFCPTGTRTSNTDTLPLESSPVRRKRHPY